MAGMTQTVTPRTGSPYTYTGTWLWKMSSRYNRQTIVRTQQPIRSLVRPYNNLIRPGRYRVVARRGRVRPVTGRPPRCRSRCWSPTHQGSPTRRVPSAGLSGLTYGKKLLTREPIPFAIHAPIPRMLPTRPAPSPRARSTEPSASTTRPSTGPSTGPGLATTQDVSRRLRTVPHLSC
jgi:hypothetical protein